MRNVFFVSFLFIAAHCGAPSLEIPDASDDAASDAGVDAAVAYPAPHPAAPKIVSVGGPILASPRVLPIAFENDPMIATIAAFTKALHGSTYWKATTSEYGIGDLEAADVVTIPASEMVPGATIDDAAIQAFLIAHLDGAHAGFGAPDASTVYTVFYPAGTTITKSGKTSCSAFGGYHRQITVGAMHVAYAVIPRCAKFGYVEGADMVTTAAGHELIEAVTDPLESTTPAYITPDDDHIAYGFYPQSELADMCSTEADSFFKPADLGFTVQRSWSNVLAAAGGSPCAPIPPDNVYYAASPVLGETVNVDLSTEGMGTIATKGVTVKLGEKKTIEVDVFSTAPTKPFNLWAFDYASLQGRPAEVNFTFDKVTGVNGDKRQLTIERVANNPTYGGSPFVVLAFTKVEDGHPIVGFVGQ